MIFTDSRVLTIYLFGPFNVSDTQHIAIESETFYFIILLLPLSVAISIHIYTWQTQFIIYLSIKFKYVGSI